jgi:hypothetical protein
MQSDLRRCNVVTTGENYPDNVEQAHIQNTTMGLYTVIVSHKGVLTNDVQDVSIVVSGNLAEDMAFQFTEVALTTPVRQRNSLCASAFKDFSRMIRRGGKDGALEG